MSDQDGMAIVGTTAASKTARNGTFSVLIEFPDHLHDAAQMAFGTPDRSIAMVVLSDESAQAEESRRMIEEAERQGTGHD